MTNSETIGNKITPTVVLDEEQEQIDFVQKHKKIPVMLTVSGDAISRQAAIDALQGRK